MQRNYKLILSFIIVVLSGLLAFSQEVEYKDVILDGKPAKLNVKTGEITLVNPELKNTNPSIKKTDEVVQDNKTQYYVVKDGETLFDISKKFKVSMAELKAANNLETTLVNSGQRLLIKASNNNYTVTESREEVSPGNSNINYHIVSKGETLYSLSKQYNIELRQLKLINGLSSNLIKVGQKLKIKDTEEEIVSYDKSFWIVVKGDTLYSIAKKSGTTVDAIKQLNGLSNTTIYIGQKLRLK